MSTKYVSRDTYKFIRVETGGGKLLTEVDGYVPAKKRIETMMLAGQRLIASRSVQYDFKEGQQVDEDFTDPTRSPNYDMADASQQKNAVQSRLAKAKKEYDAAQNAAKASKESANSSKGDNGGTTSDASSAQS